VNSTKTKEHPGEAPTKEVDGLSDTLRKEVAHHHMCGAHEPGWAQGFMKKPLV